MADLNFSARRRAWGAMMRTLMLVCAALTCALAVFLILYVLAKGVPHLSWELLSTKPSYLSDTIGILPDIISTVCMVLTTLVFVLPLGVCAAIYLTEYAGNSRLSRVIEYAAETLSGIPSILFGLFGSMFFGETLGLGYSLLTGALTLMLMVLPLITRNTQEALKTVPDSYRFGAVGLGAGKWYTIRTILLPSAMPGILTGAILAIGRIVGESAALLFTAGAAKTLPKTLGKFFAKIFQSGGTLTIQLYLSATCEGDFSTAFGIAVVLLAVVLLINMGAKALARRLDVQNRK